VSVQRKTQLRLKEGIVYYQLDEFSYKGNSSMQKELSPQDCTVISEVRAVCEVRITQDTAGGHRRNYTRK